MIPDLFTIGPFTLHSFGLMAAIALIVPGWLASRDLRERGFDPSVAWEIILGAGIGGFVGARLDYLIQNDWEGGLLSSTGLVWYGGVIGGAIGVIAVALWRKIPLGTVANVAAPGLAIGYAIGRIGCQLSGDGDYGKSSSLPWAMSYPNGTVPTTERVHPTPVYETITMFAVFWVLWKLRDRLRNGWQLFGLWCVLQSVERFLVEFLRRNDAVAAGLTLPQLVSVGILVLGVVILVATRGGASPRPVTSAVWLLAVAGLGSGLVHPDHVHGAPLPAAPACPVFPANNAWNRDIANLPVRADSDTLIRSIGLDAGLHPDFSNAGRYGIPVNVVSGTQRRVPVRFEYADESDRVGYPIPARPLIERGGDRHMLIVDRARCRLYELFAARRVGTRWVAGSGAVFDLRSNRLRPSGWTSADAAGLAILPGLARAHEVRAGRIDHALRFTAPRTRRAFILPARHQAGSSDDPALPPMGLRVRLKASVDISGYGPQSRVVLTALKRHGMILADNGSPWYITGVPGAAWDDDDLHGLGQITGADLEVVDTGPAVR